MQPYGNVWGQGWVQQPTWTTAATTVFYPNAVLSSPPASDWEKAKVKAEPDDEFTWLRKRVSELEDLAFA
jgi:hypothetical protein